MRRKFWSALVVALALGGPATAQDPAIVAPVPEGGIPAPLLTLNQERLFDGSAFGRRVAAEIEEALVVVAGENRDLEESLMVEERELTELRATLPPEEFRQLADAFDLRVEEIRRTQEAKSFAIADYEEDERQRFFELAVPHLIDLAVETGAVAILDSRMVLLALDQIDITNQAISRIDAETGDGVEEGHVGIDLADIRPAPLPIPEFVPQLEGEGGPPIELLNGLSVP